MQETFLDLKFRGDSLKLISVANRIVVEYMNEGYTLTLRQLYYQMVSRDVIPNTQKDYKKLGELISNARLAGLLDWRAIEDRTRNLRGLSHWAKPSEIIDGAAASYRIDKWSRENGQKRRVEVWVEKDALAGVLDRICGQLDVPYFSCRGYVSQSELYWASKRLAAHRSAGQEPLVIHLGDHDPSGKDMTRDIESRLEMFARNKAVEVERIALNWDQIQEFNPPPNPAKVTDSRFAQYEAEFGSESWELDALSPRVISGLVEAAVLKVRDEKAWAAAVKRETLERESLQAVSARWGEVVALMMSAVKRRKQKSNRPSPVSKTNPKRARPDTKVNTPKRSRKA